MKFGSFFGNYIPKSQVEAQQFPECVLPTIGELFNKIPSAKRVHVVPKKLVKDRCDIIFKEADHLATNLRGLCVDQDTDDCEKRRDFSL